MHHLSLYGWNQDLDQQKQTSNFKDASHGRVLVTHKTCYDIISEEGIFNCELTGHMLYGRSSSDYPCTGDWVLFQAMDEAKGIILDILPRQKTLYRQKSGRVSEKQAIASFVDKAMIVQSLDDNFKVGRVERFLLQLKAEAIEPVLILSKADLEFDKTEVEAALKHLKIQIFYTSITSEDSIEQVRRYIKEGETLVFVGSSGVGKSTLINHLCGSEFLETNIVSHATGKGKHTSTRREMILMEGSGVLIDTPGVKLFGVTNDDTVALSDVLDINSFEGQCSFADCQHINEKGCAVIEAVEQGEIETRVYENYLKLRKEAWHYTTSVQEKRKSEKSFAKMIKQVKNNHKKY